MIKQVLRALQVFQLFFNKCKIVFFMFSKKVYPVSVYVKNKSAQGKPAKHNFFLQQTFGMKFDFRF